jgi:hypothetical protein
MKLVFSALNHLGFRASVNPYVVHTAFSACLPAGRRLCGEIIKMKYTSIFIVHFLLSLLLTVPVVNGEVSSRKVMPVFSNRESDGDAIRVLHSDVRGIEVEVDVDKRKAFFVGIPPDVSIQIEPLQIYGGEVRISYTGYIRDQRVAKIVINTPVAGSRSSSRIKTETAAGKYRFRILFRSGSSSLFPTATAAATATVPTNPFEKILSRTIINYPQSVKWRKRKTPSIPDTRILASPFPRYRIEVDSDGIFTVTHDDLINAGISLTGIDPRTFRLENKGREVPVYISGEEDGSFDEEDYFEFFGEFNRGEKTYFNLFALENIYWFSWGGGLGIRLAEEDGGLSEPDPSQFVEPSSFEQVLHFEADQIIVGLTQPTVDTTDPWFWKMLTTSGQGVTQFGLSIPTPDQNSDNPIKFKMMLHGVTYDSDPGTKDHSLLAYLNGTLFGDTQWDGQSPHLFEGSGPPNNTLLNGENDLTMVLNSEENDAFLFNWVEFEYERLYEAFKDSISFTIPRSGGRGLYQFRIKGFTTSEIEIYKSGVSKIVNFLIEPRVLGLDTTYDAVFQDEIFSDSIQYIALSPSNRMRPLRIVQDMPSSIQSPSNGTELLVITHEKFLNTLQGYVNWREGQGVSMDVVTTQDIYDEFNFGIFSPNAIKEFLLYTYENWNPSPLYVLLVGDGTWDYRNIRGQGGNLLPSLLQWESDFGWVSVDNEYATVSGEDFLPDLFIGRIPAREIGELNGVLQKIMGYESNPDLGDWRRNFIFAAGSGARKNISFREIFEDSVIATSLPPFPLPVRVYADRDQNINPDPFFGRRTKLINEINGGAAFVGYFGHGGGAVWSHPNLLTNNDLHLLTNRDRLPFIASFTCFTAIFDDPVYQSLGEGLLLTPEVGAIGVWGSTSGSFFNNGLWISQAFFETLFDADSTITLGELVVGAKISYAGKVTQAVENTVLRVYTLLGDPYVLFGIPDKDFLLDANPASIRGGDTLVVSGAIGPPQTISGNLKISAYVDKYLRDQPLFEDSFTIINGSFTLGIPIPGTLSNGNGRIRAYYEEGTGGLDFAGGIPFQIGDPIFLEINTIPDIPVEGDTVHIRTRVFDSEGIDSLILRWSPDNPGNWVDILSVPVGGDTFRTLTPIPSQGGGTFIYYIATAWDSLGTMRQSPQLHYRIPLKADLRLPTPPEIILGGESYVTLSARIENAGETVVQNGVVEFYISTFPGDSLLGSDTIDIPSYSSEIAEISWDLLPGQYSVFVRLDPDSLIPELLEDNNSNETSPVLIETDRYNVTINNGTNGEVGSFDGILKATIPPQSVSQNTVISFVPREFYQLDPLRQPDLVYAPLPAYPNGRGYIVSFGDTTTTFLLGQSMSLKLFFDTSDSTYDWNQLAIYRWEEHLRRWVYLGGILNADHLQLNTNSLGIFALFINGDNLPPEIEVTVEGQAFANGDYIPAKPVISAIFHDANGIDVVEHTLDVLLEGNPVSPGEITYSTHPEIPTSVPLSYLPVLGSGNYTVRFEGYDLNGNIGTAEIQFQVIPEFQILRAGCYPNPIRSGNAVFTFTLTDRADEADLRIYTTSGRLIQSFDRGRWGRLLAVGYHEVEWNLLDRKGKRVGNGLYFVRIRARKGDEKVVAKDKVAILR